MKNTQSILQNTLVVIILAGICCLLWGSAFPCIKIGYTLFSIGEKAVSDQILFAGLRFTLAGVLVLLFFQITKDHSTNPLIPKETSTWKHILILSLFQTVLQYFFFYIGLASTTGTKASIIEGLNVFLALLVACFLFHQENITLPKALGCLIGFLGVILINIKDGGLDASLSFSGEGFIFLSTIAYAFSSVLIKKFSQTDNTILLSGWQFVMGGLVLTITGALFGGRLPIIQDKGLLMLLYLSLISSVAYTLWSLLLKYNPVSKVAVFGFMNPVFGVLLSALFLKETNTYSIFQCLLSLIFVCIGILIVGKHSE